MARAKVRARTPRVRSAQQLERVLSLDRLRGPILPGILGGAAVVAWVLSNAGVVPAAPAITTVAALSLALCLFFGLRGFLDESTTAARAAALAGFAALWAVATFYPLYRAVNPAPPLATGELKPESAPLDVSLAGTTGPYRIVVEGHLPSVQGQVSQNEHYRISVESGNAPAHVLEGDFKESWGTRRLGRRGTAPVHIVRSLSQHLLESPGGENLKIKLDSLTPAGAGSVTVRVRPDPFPAVGFAVVGAALTVAALVVDVWRRMSQSAEGLMTTLTLSAFLGIVSFRYFAPPQPGLGDLLFNGAAGAVAGWVGGTLLWKATRGLRGRLT